jgi:deazaflavin-dependent oxidoreductase (nitroreductase family)
MSTPEPNRPYLKPPWVARTVGARMARLFRPSVVTVLSVRGRRTGQWHSVSVAVLEHEGQRYLLSAYGDTEWSRNLRAAGAGRLRRRRQVEIVKVAEVPVAGRAPVMEEYLRQFGSFPTVKRSFAALPDPADHPTFRLLAEAGEPDTGRR